MRVRAFALVSGGKDSIALAHHLQQADMLEGVVSVDTGISIPEWREFMQDTCAAQGWPLEIIRSPVEYSWLVRRWGFPGPGLHSQTMRWLKERAIDIFRRRHRGALLASGARQGESKRRRATVGEWNVFGKMVVWNPLFQLSTEAVWAYMRAHNLPRSPCYATLGISGDCLCGAFARAGERDAFATCYPDVFRKHIAPLEKEGHGLWGSGGGSSRWSRNETLFCLECDPSGLPASGTRGMPR